MKLMIKLIICLELVLGFVSCGSDLMDVSHNENHIAKYVHSLITANNIEDKSATDVAIIRLKSYSNSDMYDDVLQEVPLNNVVIQPLTNAVVASFRIKTAAFIVIFFDIYDKV